MIKAKIKKILRVLGPYPYNPKLIFAFFFSFYFSRFVPVVIEQPEGWKRTIFVFLIIILAALPSFLFAGSSYLFQRFRIWSSSNFFFYLIEISIAQSLVFICNPVYRKVLGPASAELFHAPITINLELFFGSLLIGVLLLALLHNVERSISERLNEADELVKRLESDREELINSDEELRRQTSQFLHDRVQSDLMVVATKLMSIQDQTNPEINEVIKKSIARLEKIRAADLRNLVQILTPNLKGGGLSAALELLATQYISNFDVKILNSAEADSLSENQQLGLFRISEQFLLNSLVHGPATSVHLEINIDSSGRLHLSISDDGPGVEISEARPGVGTAIIDSWVSILDGHRKIVSRPGKGYKLEVDFPI